MTAALALALLVAGGDVVYVKRATRDETRQASIEATQKALPPLAQTPWKLHEGAFQPPPGDVVDTDAQDRDGRKLWRDAPEVGDGVEHTLRSPTWLYRTVTAARDTTATLTFGIDNGISIDANGFNAHVTISTYIPPVKELSIPLRLRAGTNHLLIHAGLRGATTKFLYRLSPITDDMLQDLTARLDRDFPVISERTYYRLETIATPPGVAMEVGGMTFATGKRGPALVVCTRRGEVWVRDERGWRRFADGLHEPLGIWAERADDVWIIQRTELTRLRDSDGDGLADEYEAVAQPWTVSGGHHEYVFGLPRDREGNFFVTKCALGSIERASWLGWAVRIDPRGEATPWASGLRCPNGVALSPEGDLFVTDNQGEYVGTGKLYHVVRGDFFGHPTSLKANPQQPWRGPGDIPIAELDRRRKPAAVLLPYGPMGQSPSQPLFDTTAGKFGPFAGQLFLGDQTNSIVMRVALEKVAGVVQGAVFPFRAGFQSGNNRLAFAPDGSLWVGQTDRGWGATGGKEFGIQRLVWTGQAPLEMHAVRLAADGFEVTFTRPVERASAGDPARWRLQHFTYPFDKTYGVVPVGHTPAPVKAARVSADGRRVQLVVGPLTRDRIYELRADGVRAASGEPLLHPLAYYTVNVLHP